MALQNGDMEQAKAVREADDEIDQMEKDIERLCLKLLQQQPVARDLWQISAALKMITDMERIGDQASDIAGDHHLCQDDDGGDGHLENRADVGGSGKDGA